MNTESVNLRRIPVPVELGTEVQPGDFAWGFDNPEVFVVGYWHGWCRRGRLESC